MYLKSNQQKNSARALIFALILALTAEEASCQCLVDRCTTCPDTTNLLCTTCATGWYRVQMKGGDRTYSACWSYWRLVYSIVAFIIFLMTLCLCMFLCYYLGLQSKDVIEQPKREKIEAKSEILVNPPQTPTQVVQEPVSPIRVVQQPPNQVRVVQQPPSQDRVIQQPATPVRVLQAQPATPVRVIQPTPPVRVIKQPRAF